MMKLFAIILATCTLQVNAQSSEEIALIIGGVEKIDGGGVTNEILDVEVYAPFNQDLLDSFLPVPNLKQHISFVKAIYREGEDGQGEVLACGLTNPPNGNMECFKLTLVDGELVWQEGFSGNTINTKYCSLIHQVKTETHPRTYCYESMAKRGKAWFWYSGLESWFSESVIENYISAQYCSVKINIDGTEEPVILHLGGEYYPNEFEAKPQEYPVAVCPNSAVLHPWCNGSDERVRTVEKELAVGYEYDQVIGQATCTTFHDDSGNQVVIIVPSGTLIDAVKIFRVDQCHIYNVIYGDESDTDLCTWQKRKALTPNDKIFIKMGELIEFDSKPTMFGGYVHNESNTAVDYVIQYNLNTNTWTSIKEMSKTRVRHGVVKVPASFLITPVTTEASATSPETTEASATSPVTTEASHASPITTEASATSPVTTEASSTSPVTTEASPTSPVTTEASVTPTTTLRITSSSISSPTSTEPSTTEYDTDTPTDPPTDTPTEYSSTIPTTIVETTTTELYTDFTATPTTKSTTTATTLTTTTTTSNTTGTTSTTITYETTRPTYGPTPVTLYPQPRPLITTTHATTSTTENIKYCRYYNGTTSITFTDCIQVPCPEGTSGISTVCCNPKTGQTGNVDTTDCVSEWTQNAEDMFESGVDSYNITEYIKGSISNQSDYTAGDAIHTLDLVDKLLSERNSSQGNEEDFAENVVSISNSIVSNVSPWKGMTNSTHRYKTTSTLVSNVEKAGFQYLGSRNINDCTCTYEKTMTYSNMEVRYQTSRADELHNNRMRNASIQVPDHIIQQLGTECIDSVTTNYLIQNAETQQFPNQVSPATMEQKIGSSLVDNILGLSISRSNKSFTISDGMDPFKIFIGHPEYANSEKTCAFWQFNTNSWNTKGCYYNFELSSDTETVCDCYHLTNFGIIVDFMGKIDPNDPFWGDFSTVCLSISVACIILTEIMMTIKQISGPAINDSSQRIFERQRNLFLILSQISFLLFVPQIHVSSALCEVYGGLTHFFWMLYFCWSGICGYSLYIRVTVVFGKKIKINKWLIILSYVTPAIIVGVTLGYSIISGSEIYLYTKDEKIYACWLKFDYLWIFLGPILLILIFNCSVLYVTLKIAYKAAKFRKTPHDKRINAMLRNTVVLSISLGLGFALFLIPMKIGEYIFVPVNALSGLFLFMNALYPQNRIRLNDIRVTLRRFSGGGTWVGTRSEGTTKRSQRDTTTSMKTTPLSMDKYGSHHRRKNSFGADLSSGATTSSSNDPNIDIKISGSDTGFVLEVSIDKNDRDN